MKAEDKLVKVRHLKKAVEVAGRKAAASLNETATVLNNAIRAKADTAALLGVQSTLTAAVNKNAGDIDNLRKLYEGIAYDFETDDSTAYVKDTPGRCVDVQSIGGKTVVWNQGSDKSGYESFGTKTVNGVTFTNNDDGSITIDGTATDHAYYNVNLNNHHAKTVGHVYYWNTSPDMVVGEFAFGNRNYSNWHDKSNSVAKWVYASTPYYGNDTIFVKSGVTVNKVRFYPMLIDLTAMFGTDKANTLTVDSPEIAWVRQYADAHPGYNAGELVSAPVTGVTVKGRNILPTIVRSATSNGVTFVTRDDGTTIVNGTASAQAEFDLSAKGAPVKWRTGDIVHYSGCPAGGSTSTYYLTGYLDKDGQYTSQMLSDTGSGISLGAGIAPIVNEFRPFIRIRSGVTCNNLVFKPMITIGTHEYEFSQYVEKSYPISTDNLTGYGWSAGSVSNGIERDALGQWWYVQRVGEVNLGDLTWNYQTAADRWYATVGNMDVTGYAKEMVKRFACAGLPVLENVVNSELPAVNLGISPYHNSGGMIYVRMVGASSTTFNSTIAEMKVYYALANPIRTPISLPDFGPFDTEPGGSITFDNEPMMGVPSTVEHLVKLSERA